VGEHRLQLGGDDSADSVHAAVDELAVGFQ
jgi:hypothetical protein